MSLTHPCRRGVLTLECPDAKGVVAATAGLLAELDLNITEASQFNDSADSRFFMRAVFNAVNDHEIESARLHAGMAELAARFAMHWTLHDADYRPRTLIGVSRFGHCLFDLLHRWRTGILPVDVVGVFSNHDDMRSFVDWNGLPYHYLPVTRETKAQQERSLLALIEASGADLIVLARYMQILSPELCAAASGRCINIHHSFLPSFKGAKPYQQAHLRGVKIIGATAHYVTTDLDEGPIIEQGVHRVGHAQSADDFVEIGRDVEATVLSRAVKWHAERRVMLSGQRTIVFA